MKAKKSSTLYDPNLILSCSLDLREQENKLRDIRVEKENDVSGILPANSQPSPDDHSELNLN